MYCRVRIQIVGDIWFQSRVHRVRRRSLARGWDVQRVGTGGEGAIEDRSGERFESVDGIGSIRALRR